MIVLWLLACAPDWTLAGDTVDDDILQAPASAARVPAQGTQHVWLAMDGLRVVDGPESNAMDDISFVIGAHWGTTVIDFAPWTRTPAEEQALLESLSERFDGYDVAFHRTRPSGIYTTLVITDHPDGPANGVAPLDCGNAHAGDIAFLYKASEVSAHWLQTAAAHELGHSFGLSHVVDRDDPMYWTSGGDRFAASMIDLPHANVDCVGGGWQDGPALLAEALGTTDGPAPWWAGAFGDDEGNTHEAAIDQIAAEGITTGCGTVDDVPRYCPSQEVTRGQMVTFLQRALDLRSRGIDHFDDDDGRFYEDAANAAADHGITFGCGPRRFCGDDPVTRAQMASFLARAFDYPASQTDHFDDDDRSSHEADINRIADAGVTVGCGHGKYCPDDPVLRDQMASFLSRALGL